MPQLRQSQTRQSPAALVARTVLWIVISTFFVITNVRKIAAFHAAHQTPTTWVYAQLALWCAALAFWLYTGWKDWTRTNR